MSIIDTSRFHFQFHLPCPGGQEWYRRGAARKIRGAAVLVFILLTLFAACGFAQNESTQAPPASLEATNTLETLRTYLQLQEQIHATQLAIEENRRESQVAASRHAEVFAGRLQAIEQALTLQRSRELEAMQGSNKLMLIVAGSIAALGFLAMLLMAYSHWRAMNRLAEVAASMPAARGFNALAPVGALGQGESTVLTISPAEQSNARLLGAIDRLEQRIHELEHSAQAGSDTDTAKLGNGNEQPPAATASAKDSTNISGLLGKGQSLLNLDRTEEALACFDEVLAMDANNVEALVKKGTGLERLRKYEQAIDCYDRAISLDSTMTIAYLYKGGLFNRMERFDEAIACYEKALSTQEK